MWIAIILFVLPIFLFIGLFWFILSRVRKGAGGASRGSFSEMERRAKSMPSGEAMYAMMFPDLEPLFKPEPLLEWLAWYQQRRQNRQLIRDGRRWHGEVPGFPDAATMAVTAQGKEENAPELLAMQKADGTPLAEFLIEYKADGRTLLTNNAGVFTLNPNDERKVRFQGNDGRTFAWRGPGLWNLSNPGAMPALDAQGGNLSAAGAGTGGALVAGVAAGVLADQLMAKRERERAERIAQRKAQAGGGSRSDSDDYEPFSSLDTDY